MDYIQKLLMYALLRKKLLGMGEPKELGGYDPDFEDWLSKMANARHAQFLKSQNSGRYKFMYPMMRKPPAKEPRLSGKLRELGR